MIKLEEKPKNERKEKINSGANENIIDRESQEYLIQREQVVTCLREGCKSSTIRKRLNITPDELAMYCKDIKSKKIMKLEEIEEARTRRRQEDLQFIADSVKIGLSIREIQKLKPELNSKEINPMTKELIASGVITQEMIKKNARNSSRRTINKSVELSPEEQVQFILDKLKKGYTTGEIVESDETKSLTINKVGYQKGQLVKKGMISKEEIEKAMQKRQEEILAKKHEKVINQIKEYTELGYTLKEISEFITEYKYPYLYIIKGEYIKKYGWYTKEELERFAVLRRTRRAKEAKKTFEDLPLEKKKQMIEENKRVRAKKLEENEKDQERLRQLKEYLKKGYTYREIAKEISCSVSYLHILKELAMDVNMWFDTEELNKIKEQRKQKRESKNKEAKKRKEEEKQKKIRELKEIKEERKQKEEAEQIIKLKKYLEKGYTYRKIAKEMNCSESHLQDLKKSAIKNNTWLTEEEICKNKERIKEEKANNTKKQKEEQKRKEHKTKEEEKQEKIKELKEYVKMGYTYDEISKKMNYSVGYLLGLKKLAGEWFTKEELKEFKRLRKAREALEIKEKKQAIKNYKKYKEIAQKEINLERDGKENIATEGRVEFLKVLIELTDYEITKDDIEIVLYTFSANPEIATLKGIKLLILSAYKKEGQKALEEMMNKLINILRETQFHDELIQYASWVRKRTSSSKIVNFKKKGMDSTGSGKVYTTSQGEESIVSDILQKLDILDFVDKEREAL